MSKAAILVLADTETYGDLGRVVNALFATKEFKESGDEVRLLFDGAATKWPGKLTDSNHPYHSLYEQVSDRVEGACGYCAESFHAAEGAKGAGVHLLDEFEGHPSIRRLVSQGHELLTF